MSWYHNGGWQHMMGGGTMLFGGFGMILFWGLIILVVVLLLRKSRSDTGVSSNPEKSPLDILNERYAKGEISTEEYEERKRVLTQ